MVKYETVRLIEKTSRPLRTQLYDSNHIQMRFQTILFSENLIWIFILLLERINSQSCWTVVNKFQLKCPRAKQHRTPVQVSVYLDFLFFAISALTSCNETLVCFSVLTKLYKDTKRQTGDTESQQGELVKV